MRRPLHPHHLLAFTLSLPERLLRWLVTLLGLLGHALTRLLPRPLREGKFYKLAVERQIKMLTDDVGMAGLFPGAQALDADSAKRMAVGGAVDNLMMVGLHASPLWILLAASDVSKGAQTYMRELAGELKKAGVMEEGSRLDSLDEVLSGLGRLSDKLSDTVDMPPLSVADMKQTIEGIGAEMKAGGAAALAAADVDGLADELTGLARDANHSLLETTGAVALGTMRSAGNILKGGVVGAGATVRFVGRIVWNDVLGDYGRTIQRIYRRGFYGSVRSFLRPQVRSYRNLFAYRFVSVTELLLSFWRWKRAPWRLGQPPPRPE
ncbi:MAG: hypothetical protein QNJ90_01895 [Planctomycetota bacterium]|nr:hypothetical protein [Planctomycetota bacterium]